VYTANAREHIMAYNPIDSGTLCIAHAGV